MRGFARVLVAAAVGGALAAGLLGGASSTSAAPKPKPIVIWADAAHAPVISKLLKKGYKGTPVVVVTKEMAEIRSTLATTAAKDAPDVIWSDQSWTGELAAAGSIVPVTLNAVRQKQFPANILGGYRYGEDSYGVPVQFSNLAMITNAVLVPTQPKTFDELSAMVDKLRKKGKVKRGFMVPQGPGSDGFAMYTLFSGLGGYFFKTDSAGALDATNIGLASPALLKHGDIIDGWNATKLINSDVTADVARTAFVKGNAAFWMAGPEDMATLKSLKFVYRITAVPTIVGKLIPAPLLRVQGFMVTTYAAKHGVDVTARKLVTRFMATVGRQLALAGASGLNPANSVAAKQVAERRLTAIAAAAVAGVPVPNIPQMSALWAPYGGAWVASTAGPGATPAKDAFTAAQAAAVAAVG